jgi:hypothetical protein
MNEESQYKYEGQNVPYSSEGTFSIANWPKLVGYWVICPGTFKTTFGGVVLSISIDASNFFPQQLLLILL